MVLPEEKHADAKANTETPTETPTEQAARYLTRGVISGHGVIDSESIAELPIAEVS